MWPEMLSSIRTQGAGLGLNDKELELRWRKFTLIELFMGDHCLPEEIDYFTHFKSGMSILEFYFGENFLSFEEFLECKKLFRAPRREFTNKFNSMMATIYVPERYASLKKNSRNFKGAFLIQFSRRISIDEGNKSSYIDTPVTTRVPSKVHQTGIYYISAVDSNGIVWHLLWDWHVEDDPTTRPSTMRATVMTFAYALLESLRKGLLDGCYIFFLDSRFASLEICGDLQSKGIGSVHVFKGHNAPAILWEYVGRDLEKYGYRITYLNSLRAHAVTIRTGKRKVRTLFSDTVGVSLVPTELERRKYPHHSLPALVPDILQQANVHMHHSDTLNRELWRYNRQSHHSHFNDPGEVFFNIFLQLGVVQTMNTGRALHQFGGSHLQTLHSIIESLAVNLGLRYGGMKAPKTTDNRNCWPRAYLGPHRRCSFSGCEARVFYQCKGCAVLMCKHHMLNEHGP
jgi:hypothetical protein